MYGNRAMVEWGWCEKEERNLLQSHLVHHEGDLVIWDNTGTPLL